MGATLPRGVLTSHLGRFSCCNSGPLEHRLSSCGVSLICGMWDLPGPGVEPVSPAWAGGFFTAEPLGMPQP